MAPLSRVVSRCVSNPRRVSGGGVARHATRKTMIVHDRSLEKEIGVIAPPQHGRKTYTYASPILSVISTVWGPWNGPAASIVRPSGPAARHAIMLNTPACHSRALLPRRDVHCLSPTTQAIAKRAMPPLVVKAAYTQQIGVFFRRWPGKHTPRASSLSCIIVTLLAQCPNECGLRRPRACFSRRPTQGLGG